MSQAETLALMDALIVEDLLRAGLADAATYRAAGVGPEVACQALVDQAAQFFDDESGVAGRCIVVTLFRSQVPAAARMDTVAVGGDLYRLDRLVARDESMAQWVVVHG